MDIIDVDEASQHGHEPTALRRSERSQDTTLGGIDRAGDRIERGAAERRWIETLGALVRGSGTAGDELLCLEPHHDIADRRAVERDEIDQAGLVDTGLGAHHDEGGVLYRGQVELAGLFHEYGDGDLLTPPDQVAGSGVEPAERVLCRARGLPGAASAGHWRNAAEPRCRRGGGRRVPPRAG